MAEPVKGAILTDHAMIEVGRRGLAEDVVRDVLAKPEQRMRVRPGRIVVQSRVAIDGTMYLVRVIVDVDRDPAEVVTAYRTSKIDKYWSPEP